MPTISPATPAQAATAPRATARASDPPAIARGLLADHGGRERPDLSALRRSLDAIAIQDPALGKAVETELGRLLTPVQRGQLARATYTVGGVLVVPGMKPVAEQYRAPAGSADRRNYDALDRMLGDGNPRTDDSALITRRVADLMRSGLSIDALSARYRAVDAGWTTATGDFLALFSPSALIAEGLRPVAASLARDAGLARTPWGASLQGVLDRPGTAKAFHAGMMTGMLDGAKDLVVSVGTLAGRAVQYAGDNGVLGHVGDFARRHMPDRVRDWLRGTGAGAVLDAAAPSFERGQASNAAIARAGTAARDYLATHTPAQVAADVKARIGQMWDGLKADHDAAKARGPEAHARWWGEIVGRVIFEVAATVVPVTKAGVLAKGADAAADAARVAARTTDATTDAARLGSRLCALDDLKALLGGRAIATDTLAELYTAGRITMDEARSLAASVKWKTANGDWIYPPNDGFVSRTAVTIGEAGARVRIDRYGGYVDASGDFVDRGRFLAEAGADYGSRALPPGSDAKPFRTYEVLKPLPAEAGRATPWFGEPGGAMQYATRMPVNELLEKGYIREVKP